MENIFDWKIFIEPHLFSSRNLEFTGVSDHTIFNFINRIIVPMYNTKSMPMMHGDQQMERFI